MRCAVCNMSLHSHPAHDLRQSKPLVYTAMSKRNFYYRMFISRFVLEQGAVPLNPFMNFDYFLLDAVERDVVREANNNLVMRADALWVFGDVSDGVAVEIALAKEMGKPVQYFVIRKDGIAPCTEEDVIIEPGARVSAG